MENQESRRVPLYYFQHRKIIILVWIVGRQGNDGKCYFIYSVYSKDKKSKEDMIERPSHNFESNFKNVMYLKHQESRTKGHGNPREMQNKVT